MKVYLISDTHFNHEKIATYCDRPLDFTVRLINNWKQTVTDSDCVIHLGDVFIGKSAGWREIYPLLPGRKILVRGNHDRQRSCTWWMDHGFSFACDSMTFRGALLTHEPYPGPTDKLNIHGHQHNIWHGFHCDGGKAPSSHPYFNQRLFAVEYTNYMPIEFDKFVNHPDKFQARGPVGKSTQTP